MWNDFTNCKGDGCPLAESCFRYYLYTNRMDGLISVFTKPPITEDGCRYFMDLKEWRK